MKQKPARKGKPGPKPRPKKERINLFELYGIESWTLHDCRGTLTTYLDDKRLGEAATAIRAQDFARQDQVTREARPRDRAALQPLPEIDLKAEGMALWAKTLLAAYARESRKFRDLRDGRKAA